MPRKKHNIESSCVSFDDACYDETNQGENPMPKKKKQETLEDVIDRMEEDLQKIRDKALELEDEEWDDEEDFDDEDNDDEEDK